MVHHQINGHQWLDHFGILAHAIHGRTHRCEVHQQGHPREVLQHDPRHHERNFIIARIRCRICRQIGHILVGDFQAIMIAQQAFQHDPNRDREARNARIPLLCKRGERIVFSFSSGAGRKCAKCVHECDRKRIADLSARCSREHTLCQVTRASVEGSWRLASCQVGKMSFFRKKHRDNGSS